VIGEYLVTDYSRKGFLDGRSLRLPTIVVRAGKPNAAASSFASGIIREPLNGVISECPVAPETGVWLLSPGRVVDAFIHAWELPAGAWGTQRWLNLPGITATVAQMIEALRRVAGDGSPSACPADARTSDRQDLPANPHAARAGAGFARRRCEASSATTSPTKASSRTRDGVRTCTAKRGGGLPSIVFYTVAVTAILIIATVLNLHGREPAKA
jgi:nucleoside-diphosphate-sugar epimerase